MKTRFYLQKLILFLSSNHPGERRNSTIYSNHESLRINPMEDSTESSREFGDRTTSDITIRLKNTEGKPEYYHCHSSILSKNSKFFSEHLASISSTCLSLNSSNIIEIPCNGSDYDHHVSLLKILYLKPDQPLESWSSIAEALGVLRAAITLGCEAIARSCIQYLEAVPWEEEEEEKILNIVKDLGPEADPILARLKPVNESAAKEVLLAAIHFAVSNDLGNKELKVSAQEQVEYMLMEEEEAKSLSSDEQVKTQISKDITLVFSTLFEAIASLPEEEMRLLHVLSDLNWLCDILPKIDMMKHFVSHWVDSSEELLKIVQREKLCSGLWAVKKKLVEIAGKALEAVGYGAVVIPAPSRVQLLKAWLPYLRKTKVELEESFGDGLDRELLEGIEGAVISLVLALPSNNQGEILTEWMNASSGTQFIFPNLSEAFEVWCYRAKAAKRRLALGVDGVGGSTVSL